LQHTPVECLLSGQSKYRTVKTVLTRNKILMSNETPNKNELDKAVVDLSRFDKLEINRVGYAKLVSLEKVSPLG
jgi:hypothetical protein